MPKFLMQEMRLLSRLLRHLHDRHLHDRHLWVIFQF